MIEKLAKEDYLLNMSEHRSNYLKESDFLDADIVFYFDNENFYDIKKRFSNQMNKVYFIGCLTKDIATVKDPFNTSYNDYKSVASQISDILDNFIEKK